MLIRKILVLAMTLIFATGLILTEAQAGHKHKKKRNVGIALAVGATALAIAAAAAANADRHRDSYDYSYGIGPEENAVATCLHWADRTVRRKGGLYVQLDRVIDVEHLGRNRFRVLARITRVYNNRHRRNRIRCVVRHGHVKKFKFN